MKDNYLAFSLRMVDDHCYGRSVIVMTKGLNNDDYCLQHLSRVKQKSVRAPLPPFQDKMPLSHNSAAADWHLSVAGSPWRLSREGKGNGGLRG